MTVSLNLQEIQTNPSTRRSLSELSLAVAKSKKIVIVTGAGISCSCGIPDFRSSDGLYNLVKQKYPDVVLRGRDLFDASLFRDPTSTAVFYTFISQLKESVDATTPSQTHRFIKTLDSKGKLLRSYTQNIDGLEERAGLAGTATHTKDPSERGKSKLKSKDVKNVQLHGDIHRVRCTFCSAEFPCTADHLKTFNDGLPPDCPECTVRSKAREARSARPLKIGTLRPAIVLYDEPHPLGDEIGTIQTADVSRKPDLLIVMGTSLKVHGLKKLVKEFAKAVHGPLASSSPSPRSSPSPTLKPAPPPTKKPAGKVIFVNKTAPGTEWSDVIDYHVVGETDRWVEKVLEDWKKMRPSDWEVQKTLIDDGDSKFKATKDVRAIKPRGKGAKKKLASGSENIPPVATNKSKTTSSPPAQSKALPATPLSPSKRPQPSCHYSDLESSPSKKRDALCMAENLAKSERGLLFVNKGDAAPTAGVVQKERKRQPSKEKGSVTTRKLVRARSEVWVEIETAVRR